MVLSPVSLKKMPPRALYRPHSAAFPTGQGRDPRPEARPGPASPPCPRVSAGRLAPPGAAPALTTRLRRPPQRGPTAASASSASLRRDATSSNNSPSPAGDAAAASLRARGAAGLPPPPPSAQPRSARRGSRPGWQRARRGGGREPSPHRLCKSTWGHCSIYNKNPPLGFSFRKLYMQLDEGSLTFNANPDEGVNYFMSKGILDDSPKEIAKFIFCTRTLNWKKLRIYLDERRDVLDDLVTLHNFRNQFLPNALREFFRHIHAPEERGEYLETLITKFSHRFCACNPDLMRELGLSPDAVYVLCYSLILLSIDLTSPHVKNKMSKREFIRNTRRAAQNISEDFVGHLYDNIYLIGHVAA
uniref:F-box protein 8 n=1 Tax=Anser cygnoides TaxID=8845 RepID=A0A8B9ENB8_ANSCY